MPAGLGGSAARRSRASSWPWSRMREVASTLDALGASGPGSSSASSSARKKKKTKEEEEEAEEEDELFVVTQR